MPPSRFSFDLGASAGADDLIEFEVTGTIDGEPWSEVFRAVPRLPAGVARDLGLAAIPTDGGWIFAAGAWSSFIGGVLDAESAGRFEDLLVDKVRIFEPQALADLGARLIAIYTDRPTTPPADSPNGQTPIGVTSAGGSSSAV